MTDPQPPKTDTLFESGAIPSIDARQYQAWQFAMSISAELLLMGNSEDQVVYADVGGPEHWSDTAITIYVGEQQEKGRHPHDLRPRLRMGNMDALSVWEGRFNARAFEARVVWDELWPEKRSEGPKAVAARLAEHIDIVTAPPRQGLIERSWGERWGPIFAASVDALALVQSRQPWVLQTSYRDGAGYYIHFDPCGRLFDGFYLNEARYLSCNRPDNANLRQAVPIDDFDIARMISAGSSRRRLRNGLLSVIQAMISFIEVQESAAGAGRTGP